MNNGLRVTGIVMVICLCLVSLLLPRADTKAHLSFRDLSAKGGTMTVQQNIQQVVAQELRAGIRRYDAASGAALLIDSRTGAIIALASYADDAKTETLETLTQPYEPGSIMKPLLVAAALDTKNIDMSYRYYDKDREEVGEKVITNSHPYEPTKRTLQEVVTLSLNTGAVHILEQMGDGSVNAQARSLWHRYLTERYRFGEATSTGIGSDSAGLVPPISMPAAASRYAQSAFGIGITVNPVHITAAYAAITYDGQLRPLCLSQSACSRQSPTHAVSPEVAANIRNLLISSLKTNNPAALYPGYTVGGKSGTAPIALVGGIYQNDTNNGSYIGFFGKNDPDYVLFMRLQQPSTDGYASAATAQMWAATAHSILTQNRL